VKPWEIEVEIFVNGKPTFSGDAAFAPKPNRPIRYSPRYAPNAMLRRMKWQKLGSDNFQVYRSAVPGGWLVLVGMLGSSPGVTFYADPGHKWDGKSAH
jgi:hypothetical protein